MKMQPDELELQRFEQLITQRGKIVEQLLELQQQQQLRIAQHAVSLVGELEQAVFKTEPGTVTAAFAEEVLLFQVRNMRELVISMTEILSQKLLETLEREL